MGKLILFILAIFTVVFFSSCGIYEKPCEGVTIIQQQTSNLYITF